MFAGISRSFVIVDFTTLTHPSLLGNRQRRCQTVAVPDSSGAGQPEADRATMSYRDSYRERSPPRSNYRREEVERRVSIMVRNLPKSIA
jgi:hypothetical protein